MEEGRSGDATGPAEAWLLGVRFDLYSREQLRAWIRTLLAAPPRTLHIAFSNAEFVLEAGRNRRLRDYLNGCDHNFVDSTGVMLRAGDRERHPATGAAVGHRVRRHAVRGGREEPAPASSCSDRGPASRSARPRACGAERPACGWSGRPTASGTPPRSWTASTRRSRTSSRSASGIRIQEYWVEDHLPDLEVKLVWGAGGALDFYSGDVPLAPDWVQRAGFEWLFRLVTNFSLARLRRQLMLIRFVGLVVAARLSRGRRRRDR